MENGKIYKYTNLINGKIYIGQTKQTLEQRDYKHQTQLNDNTYFHRAIKKHGYENFDFEILYEYKSEINVINVLNVVEMAYIKYYDSKNHEIGYNMNDGGGGSLNPIIVKRKPLSEETRRKISETLKSKHYEYTEEYKKNLSERMKGNTYNNGRKHTEEFKKMVSERHKGHKYNLGKKRTKEFCDEISNRQSKRIAQYDLDGNFIKEWKSAQVAGKELKISSSSIRSTCRGDYKTSGGFIWKEI